MLKREWGTETNGKLPHLSIPSNTAVWVPEFAVEDLPLSRNAALVPEFAVKDYPWAEYSLDDIMLFPNYPPLPSIIPLFRCIEFIMARFVSKNHTDMSSGQKDIEKSVKTICLPFHPQGNDISKNPFLLFCYNMEVDFPRIFCF